MNYVLERMKKSRMLALLLTLCMVFSLIPESLVSATESGTTSVCSLQFSASDLDMADITYKLGDGTAITVDKNKADEKGAIWVNDIANDTAITIQVVPKQGSQISRVSAKENALTNGPAYDGNTTTENGVVTYSFSARDGIKYYVVLEYDNTGNNTPGGEPASTGDVLIDTMEAQNGKVFYKIGDSVEWIPLDASRFTLRASNELNGVTTGTKIYLKAKPNDGQAFDDYKDSTQQDSQGNPITNNTISVQSGENGEASTVTNIDTNALQEGTFTIDYDAAKAYTVNIRFAGNGGSDNPGGEPASIGDVLIETIEAQNGKVYYSLDGQNWTEITANTFTLRASEELRDITDSALIYLKATPNDGQAFDDYRDETQKDSNDQPLTNNRMEVISGGNTTISNIDTNQLKNGSYCIPYSKANAYTVRLRFAGNGGGDNPGSETSKEYPFNGAATSTITFNGNTGYDGAGMFLGAIFYINGVAAQERTYDEENQRDTVTRKTSVTYPYDAEDPNTPKITEGETTVPAVEFEFSSPINMRYTEIKINGRDYSAEIPGANPDTRKWDILDAMDLNGNSQTVSFILTVPYAESYDVTANMEIIGNEAEDASYFPTGNFLWSNLEQDKDRDVYLDHTIIKFVKFTYVDREGKTVTYNSLEEMNKANHAYLHFDDNENAGEATLIAGGEITVRLIPRYGYQVVEFGPNGDKKSTSDTEACVYTFSIANGNAHIGAKCAPVEDKVASTVEEVKDGNIALDADELDMGTAILNVDETTTTATEQAAFETAAEGYDVESYLDLNLDQVIYRGSAEQMWENKVTDLKEKASISLTVDGDYENGVEIVHQKHDGTYEVIAAQYDKTTKTVTFETDSFSKYAICSKAPAHVHSGTKVAAVAATCVAAGNSEYYTCTCGKYFSDAACTKEIVKDSWVIPATGHKWDNGTVMKEATATEAGEKTYKCSVCGTTKTEPIPATGVPEKGTEIKDEKGTASYEVTGSDEKNPTATYTGTTSSTAKTITIPSTVTVEGITYKVTSIADNAFKGNKTITKVTIPKNVTTIGANAFNGCTKLSTVTLGSSVTSIGANAFKNCKVLAKVTIPSKVTTIGSNAFNGCTKLKTVTVGSNVTSVGTNAFKGCKTLTKITLPGKTNKIGANAFNGCSKLKTITIKSKKMTSSTISKNAFKGISSKATIKVPKGKAKTYKTLFQKKGLSKKVKVQ